LVKKSHIKNIVVPFLVTFIVIVGTIAIFSIINLATNPESRSDSAVLIPTVVLWGILTGLVLLLLKVFRKWSLGNESYP
jgi:hypothetical protein